MERGLSSRGKGGGVMTRDEQMEFVASLTNSIQMEVCTHIMKGGVPEEWDGHELRQLLADKFAQASFIKMSRKRKSAYSNAVLVNNL